MAKFIDLTGQRFERLLVLEYSGSENPTGKRKYSRWKCLCDCGNIKTILRSNLQSGSTRSCGCIKWPKGQAYDESLKKRILRNYEEVNGCWNWKKYKNSLGYGIINVKGKIHLAHRISWQIFKGEIPESLLICHTCDNPSCINPNHLWMGTNKENQEDMFKKNRSRHVRGDDHSSSKLDSEKVKKIRSLSKPRYYTAKRLAEEFKVSEVTIHNIIYGRTWRHLL